MTEKRFTIKKHPPLWTTKDGIKIESDYSDLIDNVENKEICQFVCDIETKKMVDKLNELSEENEGLKQDIEVIIDYVIHKGKYAMTVEEMNAYNRLRHFVNGDENYFKV